MQPAGTYTQGGMTTSDDVGIQPVVPPTIRTPPVFLYLYLHRTNSSLL